MIINHSNTFIEKSYTIHDLDRVHEALGIRFVIEDGHVVKVERDRRDLIIKGHK